MSESLNHIDRRLEENKRWLDEQNERMQLEQKRRNQHVLDLSPSDLWHLWPTLLMASVIGGLTEFGVSELLAHHLSLAAACR